MPLWSDEANISSYIASNALKNSFLSFFATSFNLFMAIGLSIYGIIKVSFFISDSTTLIPLSLRLLRLYFNSFNFLTPSG